MESIEVLKRRIRTATDLHSLVRTMKALAAVNIRQLEKAVESLDEYRRTIDLGLQIVLAHSDQAGYRARSARGNASGAIVFGSDQGMCGQLNDLVAQAVEQPIADDLVETRKFDRIIAVGGRVADRLETLNHQVSATLSTPGSTAGIVPLVQDLLVRIDGWQQNRNITRITVFFAEHQSKASYRVVNQVLLPMDRSRLEKIRSRSWPTNQLPTFTMDPDQLLSTLINQYLFASLYRSAAESLTSENASRLAAMRGAERNIASRIDLLKNEFNQTRQMSITEELLDIASGFEAIRTSDEAADQAEHGRQSP